MLLLRCEFQPNSAGFDSLECADIERIYRYAETLRLIYRYVCATVPVQDSIALRRTHRLEAAAARQCTWTRMLNGPINFDLVDRNRYAPLILHPGFTARNRQISTNRVDAMSAI